MNDFSSQMSACISKLSTNQLILFCNLNCEKMLPGYRLFSEVEDWGNVSFFEKIIESVFIHLSSNSDVVSIEKLNEGLAENFPNLDTFDSSIASYAFDTACAFDQLILYLKTNNNNHVFENSQSCINTVDMYIQQKENIRYVNNISELERLILEDEYMQREMNRQLTLLKELEAITLLDVKVITAMKSLNDSFGALVDYKIIS